MVHCPSLKSLVLKVQFNTAYNSDIDYYRSPHSTHEKLVNCLRARNIVSIVKETRHSDNHEPNQIFLLWKAKHIVDVWGCFNTNQYLRSVFRLTKVSQNIYMIFLTHWGRVTHICVVKLTIIGPDNGLSPGRRQAIIWTNAGILSIGPLGTNFLEILIGIQTFSFTKMHLKMSSAKWGPFCIGLNVLKAFYNSVGQITYCVQGTVYPKKFAHGFVVLCFVVVM